SPSAPSPPATLCAAASPPSSNSKTTASSPNAATTASTPGEYTCPDAARAPRCPSLTRANSSTFGGHRTILRVASQLERLISSMTVPRTIVAAALFALIAHLARADIYQWEYITPANPALGKQPSAILCPGGAGAVAAP